MEEYEWRAADYGNKASEVAKALWEDLRGFILEGAVGFLFVNTFRVSFQVYFDVTVRLCGLYSGRIAGVLKGFIVEEVRFVTVQL